MTKKIMRCFAFAVMIVALSLCFAGCDFGFNNSNGGGTDNKAQVVGIDLVGNIQTEYTLGEELNLNNAKLKVVYDDETEKEIIITTSMINGFNTTILGEKTIKITYKDKSIYKNYKVTANGIYDADYDYGIYSYRSTTNGMVLSRSNYDTVYSDGSRIQIIETLRINNEHIEIKNIVNQTKNGETSTSEYRYTATVSQSGNVLSFDNLNAVGSDSSVGTAEQCGTITINKSYIELKLQDKNSEEYVIHRYVVSN